MVDREVINLIHNDIYLLYNLQEKHFFFLAVEYRVAHRSTQKGVHCNIDVTC